MYRNVQEEHMFLTSSNFLDSNLLRIILFLSQSAYITESETENNNFIITYSYTYIK